MSVNQFDTTTPNTDFHSAGACVFERAKMLAGDPERAAGVLRRVDVRPEGRERELHLRRPAAGRPRRHRRRRELQPPPAGEPNFFMQFVDSTTAGKDKLLEFKFHVDWSNPANSTFGDGTANGNGKPIEIPVADFDSSLCNGEQRSRTATACRRRTARRRARLDSGDRLMYRARVPQLRRPRVDRREPHRQRRRHCAGTPAIRWYEVRNAERGRRRSTSRRRSRPTPSTAGWAASRWTAPATSRSATR